MNKADLDSIITFCVGAMAIVLIIGIIVGAIYYSISTSNERYYTAVNNCITSLGTWVPTIGGGACIMNNKN